MNYIDIAEQTFWMDEADEWRQEQEAAAAREREYQESGYWPAEEEE